MADAIPEGYFHKATSDSFNGAERVVIYYSKTEGDYILVINEDTILTITKAQLELVVHAGTDVLEMAAR
jgi:hypothetical protein